jgi:hypothetical protein
LKYEVLLNLSAGAKHRYKVGDVVELDPKTADEFVARGYVRPLNAPAAPAAEAVEEGSADVHPVQGEEPRKRGKKK